MTHEVIFTDIIAPVDLREILRESHFNVPERKSHQTYISYQYLITD